MPDIRGMDVSLNAHNYDYFLEQFPLGSFLQSRFWKRFLHLQGKKAWQLGVYENSHLLAHCLVYTNKLLLGKSYLYAPKGPLILPTLTQDERKEALELILSQIRDITVATRRREELFCRIEPNVTVPELTELPARQTEPIQPSTTLYLNLERPLDELFAACKEKTRYNIRLAERKGIQVHWSQNEEGIEKLVSLIESSKTRQGFRMHRKHYYRLLLQADTEHTTVHVNWATHEGIPIAANLYLVLDPTMTYIHGGFNYEYRHLMAPYLLQWAALQKAVELRLAYYDFWGYAPRDGSKPSWAGFSRFKEGFGGTVVESPGCFDYLYNPMWYNVYTKMRTVRRSLPF